MENNIEQPDISDRRFCYGLLPSEMADPTIKVVTPIIIIEGERGYWKTDWKWKKEHAEAALEQTNAKLGIDPNLADFLMARSMAPECDSVKPKRGPKNSYPLAYKLAFPETPLTRAQLENDPEWEGYGAADAVLIASIIYPPDGSLSILFIGQDGRTKTELEDAEWFKVWGMLSDRLAKSTTLDPVKAMICEAAFDLLKRAMFQQRPEGG